MSFVHRCGLHDEVRAPGMVKPDAKASETEDPRPPPHKLQKPREGTARAETSKRTSELVCSPEIEVNP